MESGQDTNTKILDLFIGERSIYLTIQFKNYKPEILFLPTSDFWKFIVRERLNVFDEEEAPINKEEFLTDYKSIAEGIIKQKWRILAFKK